MTFSPPPPTVKYYKQLFVSSSISGGRKKRAEKNYIYWDKRRGKNSLNESAKHQKERRKGKRERNISEDKKQKRNKRKVVYNRDGSSPGRGRHTSRLMLFRSPAASYSTAAAASGSCHRRFHTSLLLL